MNSSGGMMNDRNVNANALHCEHADEQPQDGLGKKLYKQMSHISRYA